MSMKIIAPLAALIIAANVWAIAPAVDRELSNQQSANMMHQADNDDNQADIDDDVTYQAIDGKAYKVVDGLVSNEWQPLTSEGYIDDYDISAKAKEIKAANAKLRKIKGM